MRPGVSIAHRLGMGFCAIAAIAYPVSASAASIAVGPGLRVEAPLRSVKDLRDSNVVKQRFDYSCGAAALASILRYGFGEAVSEREILVQLFSLESADQKELSVREGFSLLDLQRVAQARGYRADGFRIEPQNLARLSGPVIVFIQPNGYKHFAVLRGLRGDRVYLADPSLGNIRLPLYRFLESWRDSSGTGIIFVVEPEKLERTSERLIVSDKGIPQPEIMTVREMLAVGNPFLALPELSR